MKSTRAHSLPNFFLRWLIVLATACSLQTVHAANLELEIILIWGTNDAKSPKKEHKPVDKELAKKLHIYKWKNYFEIRRFKETVPNRDSKRIKISDKCEIVIKELEGPKVEVELYGEGKLINRTTKQLDKSEYFVLAGDDKNDNAWFIVIKLVEEKR